MTRRQLGLVTFVAAVSASAAVVTWHVLADWREGPGPKLQRECVSLVDTVFAQEQVVSRESLRRDLERRGVAVPPTLPRLSEDEQWTLGLDRERRDTSGKTSPGLAKREAAEAAYATKWEEIERSPEYRAVYDNALAWQREEAIRQCVRTRAAREGVRR